MRWPLNVSIEPILEENPCHHGVHLSKKRLETRVRELMSEVRMTRCNEVSVSVRFGSKHIKAPVASHRSRA